MSWLFLLVGALIGGPQTILLFVVLAVWVDDW